MNQTLEENSRMFNLSENIDHYLNEYEYSKQHISKLTKSDSQFSTLKEAVSLNTNCQIFYQNSEFSKLEQQFKIDEWKQNMIGYCNLFFKNNSSMR